MWPHVQSHLTLRSYWMISVLSIAAIGQSMTECLWRLERQPDDTIHRKLQDRRHGVGQVVCRSLGGGKGKLEIVIFGRMVE